MSWFYKKGIKLIKLTGQMYPENLDNDVNLQIKYSPPSAGCCVFKDSQKFYSGTFFVLGSMIELKLVP